MIWLGLALAADCATGPECHALGLRSIDPVRSVALFERGCTLGEPKACVEAARAYDAGVGVGVNATRAKELRDQAEQIRVQACMEKDGERCFQLAEAHPEAADQWYRQGCAAEHLASCAALGTTDEAFQDKACSLGDSEACNQVEQRLWKAASGASKAGNREEAIAAWTTLHERFADSPNEPLVLFNLGNSNALLARPAEALRWFALADALYPTSPTHPQVLEGMAEAHESLGNLDAAEACWGRLAAEHPESAAKAQAGLARVAERR